MTETRRDQHARGRSADPQIAYAYAYADAYAYAYPYAII